MQTILILAIEAVIVFTTVVLVEKFFGKKGLFALAPVLLVAANIGSSKLSALGIGNLTTTLGIPCFSAIFLATDILNEKYSRKDARNTVTLAVMGQIFFLIATGITMIYPPAEFDTVHGAIVALFSVNWRVTIASLVMFAVSNYADVWLFDFLKRKNTPLWVRNNVATITTNCLENFLFLTIAFAGTMPIEAILTSALVCSVIEMCVSVLDTPFLYWAKKNKVDREIAGN